PQELSSAGVGSGKKTAATRGHASTASAIELNRMPIPRLRRLMASIRTASSNNRWRETLKMALGLDVSIGCGSASGAGSTSFSSVLDGVSALDDRNSSGPILTLISDAVSRLEIFWA